jgi:transcriptional regulator with XRE-family HTH domain
MATKTIYQNTYRHLVDQLRTRRESLGISQAVLASHLGWPQQTISSVEAGARRLDVLEYLRLTSALGMSAAEVSALLMSEWKTMKVAPIR